MLEDLGCSMEEGELPQFSIRLGGGGPRGGFDAPHIARSDRPGGSGVGPTAEPPVREDNSVPVSHLWMSPSLLIHYPKIGGGGEVGETGLE